MLSHGQAFFSRPLNLLMSYAHTVSIPSPVMWSGVQCGKGNRQAITLASSSSSCSSFFSSCGICGEQQPLGSQNSNKGEDFKMPFHTLKSLKILSNTTLQAQILIKQPINTRRHINSSTRTFSSTNYKMTDFSRYISSILDFLTKTMIWQ